MVSFTIAAVVVVVNDADGGRSGGGACVAGLRRGVERVEVGARVMAGQDRREWEW